MSTFQAATLHAAAAPGRLRRLWARCRAAFRIQRERAELARLDDRTLRDFAVTRLDAQNEARRRFWDLPPMA